MANSRRHRRAASRFAAGLLCAAVIPTSGCSLFILAGRVLSDGRVPAPFHTVSDIDLTDGEHETLLLTSITRITPSDQTFEIDLRDAVLRKFRGAGITVGRHDVVDDLALGGGPAEPRDVFDETEADVVVEVRLDEVSLREEGSPDLFLGRLAGRVSGYSRDGGRVFDTVIEIEHPSQPEPIGSAGDRGPRARFLEVASRQIAEMFYEHKVDFDVF